VYAAASRADAIFERDETGSVVARPRQAIDEAGDDRIGQYAVALSAASGMSTSIRRIGSDCYARRKRPCRSAEQRHELAPVAGGTRFA